MNRIIKIAFMVVFCGIWAYCMAYQEYFASVGYGICIGYAFLMFLDDLKDDDTNS